MVIKHGACSHPMSGYGQEVCLAVHWRKASIGARDRWSALSRKLPAIVPVRARARTRVLPRVRNQADQFLCCVRLSFRSSRHKGKTLKQMRVLSFFERRAVGGGKEFLGTPLPKGLTSE